MLDLGDLSFLKYYTHLAIQGAGGGSRNKDNNDFLVYLYKTKPLLR